MTAELTVTDLRVRYGAVEVLHGLSLRAAGGITALIGANGAGKSTLMKTVSGLLTATHGRVELDGERVDRRKPHQIVARGIVQVPEGRQLFPEMTVLENLEIGGTTAPRNALPARLTRVFEIFPVLAERRAQAVGTLSGGEQQMVAIGRALVAEPKVLLLDEPSLGLAPVMVDRIADTIRALAGTGMTVLLVEQNARVALDLATHAYVLATGEIGLSGPADELRGDPQVVQRYLGGGTRSAEDGDGSTHHTSR
jgi:branched-chain amino acid transport system ATP-binding protein